MRHMGGMGGWAKYSLLRLVELEVQEGEGDVAVPPADDAARGAVSQLEELEEVRDERLVSERREAEECAEALHHERRLLVVAEMEREHLERKGRTGVHLE